jgi:uncharacterized damage-inducible protein DinB
MNGADLLVDAFERIKGVVHQAAEGLSPDELAIRLDPGANSIGWLIWHLTRVQDDHIATVAGLDQVWTSSGWADRFGLPFDDDAIGYGHSSYEVGLVAIESSSLLVDYYDATHEQTLRYLETVSAADLDRVVDERWDPPVTLAVRLVSIVSDDLQHVGQAHFVRGVIARRS